ncbi:Fatty acid synthase 3 [Carabus blaptoides fortunei]
MQRMALEQSFEALIDAGINPVEVRGKRIGVYMGSTISENDSLMLENVISGFGVTGQARNMLSNRISYWLNVIGVGVQDIKNVCPSLIDVACHNGPTSCTISGPKRGTGNFEINDRYGVVASGRILMPENFDMEIMEMPPVESNEDYFKFKTNDFYSEFQDRRYQFSGPFRTVQEVNLFDEGEDRQSLLIPKFIRRISINFEQLPTSEQVLDVSYHYGTKIIKSTAIQIHDIHYKALPVAQKHLIVDKTTFMKYAFNNIPDLETGLDICVRIVQKSQKTGGIQITEIIDSNTESLTVYIKKFSQRSAGSKIYINTVEDIKETIPTSSLIILSDCYLPELNTLLSKTAQYALLYLLKSEQFIVQYPIMSVFAFEAGKYQYHLVKRACNEIPKIITVKSKLSNPNYIKDPSSLQWFSQLRTALTDIKHADQRIFLG